MQHIYIPLLLVFLGVIAAVLLSHRKSLAPAGAEIKPYETRRSLFTPAERSFFGVLESLNYEGVTLTSKVRLADVFAIKKSHPSANRLRAFNQISAKHVDFLLIQKTDGKPLLGIELDDSSHELEKRVVRDDFVDQLFTGAKLPLLRVAVKAAYDPNEIRRQIDLLLKK